jgi:sulfite exporter TauE/SafE
MELIWTSFLLGLVGSLHCAGMCGPLALAVPSLGNGRTSFVASRLLNNSGRVTTYIILGIVAGGIGRTLALAGWQRWLSIGAGLAILAGLLLAQRANTGAPAWRGVLWLKRTFSRLLHRGTPGSVFALGAINGLLPCGLVYVAAAGATATGHPLEGAAHMAAFGVGTMPLMLGIGLAQKRLAFAARWRGFIPASVALVAVLLVLRGLGLGIPYLSPDLTGAAACH